MLGTIKSFLREILDKEFWVKNESTKTVTQNFKKKFFKNPAEANIWAV